MKKILNTPEGYVNDMLAGIYAAHADMVRPVGDNLRCYQTAHKTPGKVAIITGGGSGHLPLFLGYVGKGILDGCAVGGVFQSPSAEEIYEITKAVDNGAGVLYLFGNYSGDILNFEMAGELADMDGIKTCILVGNDDVASAAKGSESVRRGVAGIFFMYKCAGAKADEMASLEDVKALAEKVGSRVRTMGFALSPCIIPEVGHPNFTVGEDQISIGMGIHGEPGIRVAPMLTAQEIAKEALDAILLDMPFGPSEQAAVLINGLGSTPLDELYILYNEVAKILKQRGIDVFKVWVGEFATSMEMAGASVSVLRLDDEIKALLSKPAHTPFYSNPQLED
ncbi:MAG: dihydroxyacetone kinase subunit DhaK [Defluviitaleaceae bacterium]|nr:dihydroxyacetone kinase subunit DhaK [Defluviitaleaceae bacterium]